MEKKIELHRFTDNLKKSFKISDKNFGFKLSKFLNENNWFGCKVINENGKYYVPDELIENHLERIELFCRNYGLSIKDKSAILDGLFSKQLPDTLSKFEEFATEIKLSEEDQYFLKDCILYNLPGELVTSSDKEMHSFMNDSLGCLTVFLYKKLCFFVAWTRDKYKVAYTQLYTYKTEVISNPNNEAYEIDEYLKMLYFLYNEDFAQENGMYLKAAKSKNYADTWLFLSLHFIGALRSSDSIRLPHPKLLESPEETLKKIINNEFEFSEAVYVLNTVLWTLKYMGYIPHKTSRFSSGETIKLEVPHSVEVHIGKLFAIAESHFQLNGGNDNESWVKVITSYSEIKRYMGEEIGELFRESDFRIRSANKSYLQSIELLTGQILGVENEYHVKGYVLASLARSHKGSYGEFAKETLTYLKDAKMNGYSIEFVTRELFERGPLSSVISMMLSMITNGEYDSLSAGEQTSLIKEFGLTPFETENSVIVAKKATKKGIKIANEIIKDFSKENILRVLHNIADGTAAAKDSDSLCFLSAVGLACKFSHNCGVCEFEIATKATLYTLVKELYRLKKKYKSTTSTHERDKCRYLIQNKIAPAIDEMLNCYRDLYGKDELKRLEVILKESTYD